MNLFGGKTAVWGAVAPPCPFLATSLVGDIIIRIIIAVAARWPKDAITVAWLVKGAG